MYEVTRVNEWLAFSLWQVLLAGLFNNGHFYRQSRSNYMFAVKNKRVGIEWAPGLGGKGKEAKVTDSKECRIKGCAPTQWRQRGGAALRSSKRCLVAMAAPSFWSPWERQNPVAARLCPWARGREGERGRERMEGGKKNSNRTASLAGGVWADLENVWRVLILSLSLSLLFLLFIRLCPCLVLSVTNNKRLM